MDTLLQTMNPTTEQIINTYPLMTPQEINLGIEQAHMAFQSWRKTDFAQRRALMLSTAQLLKHRQDALAHLMALEMGKPISEGVKEIEKCILVCEHFAEAAEKYLSPVHIKTDKQKSTVYFAPMGTVFAIMPWNFPFWQVFRLAAPTLMAGNTIILKHAPISTGSGNAIAELLLDAGFPAGVFQHFILDNDLEAQVIAHNHIVAVTLTGGEKAGSAVAALAGQHLKKTVLELGGNDPYIILEDADLDHAAQCIVTSRLKNAGQVCIAAKRIIAVDRIYDDLLQKVKKLAEQTIMGNPLEPQTAMGPMARNDLRQTLQKQINDSVAKGAKLLLGGTIPPGKGFYYPPTLLSHVTPGLQAFDDELFGPVIVFIRAQDEKQAISLANHSRFGLGGGVFTRDISRGERIARDEIETCACFVNTCVSSDPRLPFGGIKQSGYGRELAQEGILAFMNVKTVAIK